MKRMTKFMSLALLAVFGLTGCGSTGTSGTSTGGTSTNSGSNTQDTSTTTTDDKASYNYTIKVGSPAAQVEWVVEKVQAYVKAEGYTNVKIEGYTLEEDRADSITDWSTGPDVFAFAGDKILNLAPYLATVPTATVSSMNTSMGEDVVEAATLGDKVLAYPFTTNTFYQYYNSEYISAEEVLTLDGLIAANKEHGLKANYNLKNSWYGIPFLCSYGAKWDITLNEDGNAVSSINATFDTDEGLKAVKKLYALLTNADVATTDGDQPAPTQGNGYGSVVTGSWKDSTYKEAVGEDKLKATRLPLIETGVYAKNFLGYKLYGVNSTLIGSDTKRAALDNRIAAYLVSKEMQVARYQQYSSAPVDQEAIADSAVASDQTVKAVADQISTSVPQTVVPSTIWGAYDALYTSLIGLSESEATDTKLTELLATFNEAVEKIS